MNPLNLNDNDVTGLRMIIISILFKIMGSYMEMANWVTKIEKNEIQNRYLVRKRLE